MDELSRLRLEMDGINAEMLTLFKKRLRVSEEIGRVKRENGIPTLCPEREAEIIGRVKREGGIYSAYCAELFRVLMDTSKQRQEELRRFALRKSIALIGMPGCGKTTIGRILADFTRLEFTDTDGVFESEYRMSAGAYITERGEAEFRRAESDIIARIAAQPGRVIATGGGAVLCAANRSALTENCYVYYIKRDARLLPLEGRPLSEAAGVDALLRQREPLYMETCAKEIDNSGTAECAALEIYYDYIGRSENQ